MQFPDRKLKIFDKKIMRARNFNVVLKFSKKIVDYF